MVGQAEISCGVNGLWSNEYPTCGKIIIFNCDIQVYLSCFITSV